jgi:hypothetical protein
MPIRWEIERKVIGLSQRFGCSGRRIIMNTAANQEVDESRSEHYALDQWAHKMAAA